MLGVGPSIGDGQRDPCACGRAGSKKKSRAVTALGRPGSVEEVVDDVVEDVVEDDVEDDVGEVDEVLDVLDVVDGGLLAVLLLGLKPTIGAGRATEPVEPKNRASP